MRRVTTVIAIAILCAWLAAPVGARQAGPTIAPPTTRVCGSGEVADSIDCLRQGESAAPTLDPPAEETSADSPTIKYKTTLIPKIWGASDGEVCIKMVAISVPEDEIVDPDGGLPHDRYSLCPPNLLLDPPVDPGLGAGLSPAPDTAGTLAIRYWRSIPLPKPEPHIAPGRAITGLLAYLETRGSTTYTYTEPDTPFGPLTIVATGKYYVDWGDGTRTGPHSREGGPWPDGRITHEYINIGDYDVVVTERWTATWSFGAESGVLDELRTVGRIEDFPVQQIQAVVIR
jgi:hypothetical protein